MTAGTAELWYLVSWSDGERIVAAKSAAHAVALTRAWLGWPVECHALELAPDKEAA